MPTERPPGNPSQLVRHFWLLLALILILALVSSAAAVRTVVLPFLAHYQQEAMAGQARKAAAQLDARLANHQQLMRIVATDPDVVNVTLGYSENRDYVSDLLDSLPLPEDLSWVTLFDAFGQALVHYDIREEDRGLLPAGALRDMVAAALADADDLAMPVVVQRQSGFEHLALATRVRTAGLTEGVLLAGYRLDMGAIFVANDITERTFLVAGDTAIDPRKITVMPMASLPVSVAMVPEVRAIVAAGRALVSNSVTAVAAVLVGAFATFALLGRKVVVEPHRKLESQTQELERQKRELAELAAIAQRANDAVLVTDLTGHIQWANPAFENLTGYQLREVCGRRPGDFLQGPDTSAETVRDIGEALARKAPIKRDILNYDREGKPYWISLSISPLERGRGECYGFVSISSDITEARNQQDAIVKAKREIEYQALHDPLTRLPNRRALDAELKHRRNTPGTQTTVVRIDLDNFKFVNDTMGHEAGDFMLCAVAEIIALETKPTDLAARVGGDEFVLLLDPAATEEDGVILARRILARIREPKIFEGKTVRIGGSFGIASTASGLLGLDDLIIGADAALYEAKNAGRNRVHVYSPALHRAVQSHRELASELRRAIAREEFEPFFHPQFDAATLEIRGVETLARWRSPDLGLLMPDRFLPVAQQLSVLEEIDDIIFRKALAQLARLREEGIFIPKVSFNVTAERIQAPAVLEAVRNRPADGPTIAFEILESVLVEEQTDFFHFGLDQLREAGVRIEIDDFGSGHASIIGLLQLRPDAMKIDQRLVRPILSDPLALDLLENIIQMGRLMQLDVVAEGVETMEHARALRGVGCATLQGFAFCKPMDMDALRDFAAARHPDTRHPIGVSETPEPVRMARNA